MQKSQPIDEVANFYRILPLQPLRRTPGVSFDVILDEFVPKINAIDRVIHAGGAISPGPVGDIERPWYMHPCQGDNLLVLQGTRQVDIYTHEIGEIFTFEVTPQYVKQNGVMLFDGPAILVWPRKVFHRIVSNAKTGSASVNLATHYDGFDINTNFSIYDIDIDAKTHRIIRSGGLDQM